MILDSDPEILEFWFWTKKNIWRWKILFVKEKKNEKEKGGSILRRNIFFVGEKMNGEIKVGKYLVKENIFLYEEKRRRKRRKIFD